MRTILRALLRLLFRFQAFNTEVLKTPGPVLLIPNHVCWLDWLFLHAVLDLDWKFVVSNIVAQYSWLHRKIMVNRRTFPVEVASPYAVKRLAEYLEQGGRLVLFAEGQMTYTGSLMKLYEGTGFLLYKTRAKLITCYIRGADRLRWSRQPGWRKWWPEITLHFSAVLEAPKPAGLNTSRARGRVTDWLRGRMLAQQFQTELAAGPDHVLSAIIAAAQRQPGKVILQDATMQALTYRRMLIGADLLAGRLEPALPPAARRVGVLLPNVNATPIVLLSLWALGKAPAVLNYTTGVAILAACSELADLKHVVTSRAFLARLKLNLEPLVKQGVQIIFLEDLRAGISKAQKLSSAVRLRLRPAALARRVADGRVDGDAPAVILFTSGSEGVPKGVVLTHRNLLANIKQMSAMVDLQDHDRFFNALPLFHSFGLTIGALLGLARGLYVFLYPSPLHYRVVPALLYDRHCTIFLSTNTFLNGYARKAHQYDFRSVRYLFAGGEKVQEETARAWAQRFGVRILEGYGATECSPCLTANVPLAARLGSAGRFLPGIEYRLEPIEGVAEGGALFVRGSNVMQGYLNPEANAAFQALGGWYDTGDIGRVDDDGFLFLLGRWKRFAKVSGEMVSLTAVEDALAGAFPHYGLRCQVAVVARPDEDKGEALVAVTNEAKLHLDEIRSAIRAKGLPNLCVPREVRFVRELPKLGTGKINHRELIKLI
jgi:acyl-[acyl-carrier-protein]-phospholipid O-acyltransferase/long-chain-fatty-acid--[acyl-carrier-protein] ligase